MQAVLDKWDRIYSQADEAVLTVADVLAEQAGFLPRTGSALDLACGLGGNALFLARRGLAVTAMDISSVAIEKLQQQASRQGLSISARQENITAASLKENRFDVIVVSRFLDRTLMNAIIAALNPGGLLFYQTFRRDKQDAVGPNNPGYLLAENELLQLFSPLTVIFYKEYALNPQTGFSNEAQFIGRQQTRDIYD